MFSIYIILTTHFSHFYLIWDFTYTCNPTISPSHVSLPLYGLQDLFVGHEQVPLTSPYLMDFSLHQRVIHGSLVCHSWEPRVNPARTSMGTPHVHVHGTSHHTIIQHHQQYSFVGPFFFFSKIFVCGPFRLFYPRWIGTINTLPPSLQTTMSSNTTCWGINTSGNFLELLI